VGSSKSQPTDVRIIAATHRNLEEEIMLNHFREDLYYRLHVFPIELPPLRERLEDLEELAESSLERCDKAGLQTVQLTASALRALSDYDWPGNVRELSNLMERLCILYPGGKVDQRLLPARYTGTSDREQNAPQATARAISNDQSPEDVLAACNGMPVKEYLESIEIALIDAALKQAGGIVAHAAETLQIRRTTLSEKMKRYGIELDSI